MEVEESSSDSSLDKSLVTSRGRSSTLMRVGEPSLLRRNIGIDSTGMLPERLRRESHLACCCYSGDAIDFWWFRSARRLDLAVSTVRADDDSSAIVGRL